MTQEEMREQAIEQLSDILRVKPFTVEFEVKDNPTGIRVVLEVTQEELNEMVERASNKSLKAS